MNPSHAFARLTARAREFQPEAAIVLGSGMGAVARRLKAVHSVSFADCPGLAATDTCGHAGTVTLGEWAGRRILAFEGRLHFYEGHPWECVTAPVSMAAALGARVLVATNAAGGIHPALVPGSLMAVRDHLEWLHPNCWQAPNANSPLYSEHLTRLLLQTARECNLELHHGTYAAVTGPCYETPAEIRALQAWGADAVGMSTTREIRAGCKLGMECVALSCITNRAAGLSGGPIHHEEVLTIAEAAADRLAELLEGFLKRSVPSLARRANDKAPPH